MKVLLPGRYDPIHLGHWLLIYDALERFSQVIVGIQDTQDDLFSTDDRFRIAVKALDGDVIDMPRHGHYSATELRRRLELGLDIGDLIVPGTAALIWRLYERIRSGHPA